MERPPLDENEAAKAVTDAIERVVGVTIMIVDRLNQQDVVL